MFYKRKPDNSSFLRCRSEKWYNAVKDTGNVIRSSDFWLKLRYITFLRRESRTLDLRIVESLFIPLYLEVYHYFFATSKNFKFLYVQLNSYKNKMYRSVLRVEGQIVLSISSGPIKFKGNKMGRRSTLWT